MDLERPSETAPVASTDDEFARDVVAGLTRSPKVLAPKYFYDELGSCLFEAICHLPEYYVARAETEIFARHAGQIAQEVAPAGAAPLRLIELGSGESVKTRALIDALVRRGTIASYTPIDISPSALGKSEDALRRRYPELPVEGRAGDYQRDLPTLLGTTPDGVKRFALFLGSTLGNLHPPEAEALLASLRSCLQPGDAFLLGVDLKKDESVLLPAYDDRLGVTAAFNKNLLARINRELGADFDLDRFAHRAVYDRGQGRIEMHLVSRQAQTVAVRAVGLTVAFAAGEAILSECSYKFDRAQIERLATATGFAPRRTWTDLRGYFASNLLLAV